MVAFTKMKHIINLTGKKIVIAGASSGMGAETAVLCSELGAQVIAIARREEKLNEVIGKLSGSNHRYFAFDLNEIEKIEGFVKTLVGEVGPLDGLVYCAGIPGTRPLRMLKPAALTEVMNINFNAFVETVRCVTKKHSFNPGMSIVGISSISSTVGSLGKTSYCASKAAMDSAVRCMAKELAPNGIRVNTVCPGIIETALFQQFKNNAGDSQDAQLKIQRQYLGVGKPSDVANTIVFLLSDAPRLITGSSIAVDGGMLSS